MISEYNNQNFNLNSNNPINQNFNSISKVSNVKKNDKLNPEINLNYSNQNLQNFKNSFNPKTIYQNGLILNYNNQIPSNFMNHLSKNNSNKSKKNCEDSSNNNTKEILTNSLKQNKNTIPAVQIPPTPIYPMINQPLPFNQPPIFNQQPIFNQPPIFNQQSLLANPSYPQDPFPMTSIPGMIPYPPQNIHPLYSNLKMENTESKPKNKYFNSLKILDNIHSANKMPFGKYLQMKFCLSQRLGFCCVEEKIPEHMITRRKSFFALNGGADRNVWLTLYSDKTESNSANIDFNSSVQIAYKNSMNKFLKIYNHKLFKTTYLTCKLNFIKNKNIFQEQEKESIRSQNITTNNFMNQFAPQKNEQTTNKVNINPAQMNIPNFNPYFNPGVPRHQYYIPSPIPGFYPHNVHPLSYYHFQPILFQQNVGDYMGRENIQNQSTSPMYKNYVYNNPYTYNFYGNVSSNQFQKMNHCKKDTPKKNETENFEEKKENYSESESENYSEEQPIKQKRGRKKENKKLVDSEIISRETFSRLDYLNIPKNSKFYNNISNNFSFPLKELLKFEEIVDQEILKRSKKEIFADLKNLNRVPAFSRYIYEDQSLKTDFKIEYEENLKEDVLDHGKDTQILVARRAGHIIKLMKENYGLICTPKEIKNLLQTNRGYKKVINMIIFKNSKIKNFILDQRNI